MSALLKPIANRCIERPAYRGYEHVRRNEMQEWIALNLDQIRAWWRAGHENRPTLTFDELDFQPFCCVQFDIERMRFEELREDGKHDEITRYLGDE